MQNIWRFLSSSRFQILSWGVRNIKGNSLCFDPNIRVEFECNQTIIKSDEVIKNVARCPNFSRPVLERKILVSCTWGKHLNNNTQTLLNPNIQYGSTRIYTFYTTLDWRMKEQRANFYWDHFWTKLLYIYSLNLQFNERALDESW